MSNIQSSIDMPASDPNQQYNYTDEDELSLIDLWKIVWKRKWPWLTFGPLAGIIGIYIALTSAEIYRSEVLLAPASDEEASGGLAALAGQFGGLASMAGVNIGGGSDTATAIANLKSRQFLLPYLLEQDLFTTLFQDEWNAEAKEWIGTNKRRDESGKPTNYELFERFTEIVLSVSEDKKTGFVTLGIEWEDPDLCANWAAELPVRLNDYLRKKAKAETEKNLEYLEEQLNSTQIIEIRETLFGLVESQTQNAMLANAKEEYAFRIIDHAYVPEVRVRPQRTLIVLASGMLGGFFGIFLCFMFHFVDKAKIREI